MSTANPKKALPGRRSRKPREASREHILDGALALFAHQGVAGTTIAQIAEAAGVTSAMVHYYFANREGLLDALVAERLAPAIAYVWGAAADEAMSDPRRLIPGIAGRLLETVERIPQLPALWTREVLHSGGLLRGRILPHIPLERLDGMRRSIESARGKGAVNGGISPALVLPSILGVIMLPLAARDLPISLSSDLATLKKHAVTLLLDGLCAPSETEGRP